VSPATSRPNGTSDDGGPAVPPSEPPSGPGEPPLHPADTPSGVVPAGPPPGTAAGPPAAVPPYPVAVPTGWPAADRPRRSWRRSLGVHLGALLVLVLLGLPFGLVWAAVAPGVPVLRTEDGAILAQPQPEEFIAADGWFSLLGLVLGVGAAIAAWALLRQHRGPVGMLVVVVGMLGAATLAWQVGRRIGLSGYERLLRDAPAGTSFTKPPDLHGGQYTEVLGFVPAIQDLLVPAFGAAVVYTLLAGWSRYPDLRPEPEPAGFAPAPVSWDSTAPPAPPAAPAPPGPDGAEPPRG